MNQLRAEVVAHLPEDAGEVRTTACRDRFRCRARPHPQRRDRSGRAAGTAEEAHRAPPRPPRRAASAGRSSRVCSPLSTSSTRAACEAPAAPAASPDAGAQEPRSHRGSGADRRGRPTARPNRRGLPPLESLRARLPVFAAGRSTGGDRAARGGPGARRQGAGPARCHRLRQDLLDRQGGGARQSSDARPVAQQDARGAAVPGVSQLLSPQRGRVLRLLLRLLPARGLRPAVGHLHREGNQHQRGDRPPSPARHEGALRAPGRAARGLGVVHLRPGLAGVVLRDAGVLREGESDRNGPGTRPAGRHAVRAHLARSLPRQLPGPRRHSRDSSRPTTTTRCGSSTSATRSSASPASTRCAAMRSSNSIASPSFRAPTT